jgi:hypothetical protein
MITSSDVNFKFSIYLVNNISNEPATISLVNEVLKYIEKSIYFGAKEFDVEVDFFVWSFLTRERLDFYIKNKKNSNCVFFIFQHSLNYPDSIFPTLFLQTIFKAEADKLRMDILNIPKSLVFSFTCNKGSPFNFFPNTYLMKNIITFFQENTTESFLIFTKPDNYLPIEDAIHILDLFHSKEGLKFFWEYFNEKEKMMFQRYNWITDERYLSDYKIAALVTISKSLNQPKIKMTTEQKTIFLAENNE